jgi:hypothetical protein
MAYTLQTGRTGFVGGKNILASEHLQFLEAGATLDATKFPVGKIELGELIARNATSGKFEPFTTATGFDEFGVLNIDVDNNGTDDTIVGEVIVRGSVYEAKLPTAPSAEFKGLVPMIRFVKEV